MDYLQQVQKAVDFIEANLDQPIALQAVAQAAGISHWHFQRIFKALSNETLKTYIRSRRMARALEKLLNSEQKIIDIAISAGFATQESFSRAFKQAFSITPNEYRKLGDNSLFLKKLQIDRDYLLHVNQNVSLEPEIYQQEAMQLVGLKTSFYSVDSEKNNIADKLPPLWEAFLNRMDRIPNRQPDKAYGVIQQLKQDSSQLEYTAAVEVRQTGELPAGMSRLKIPAATYACFAHQGEVKNLDNTVNYIYSNWLLGSGYTHTYGPDLEIYGADYHPVSKKSVIHYAIPIDGI